MIETHIYSDDLDYLEAFAAGWKNQCGSALVSAEIDEDLINYQHPYKLVTVAASDAQNKSAILVLENEEVASKADFDQINSIHPLINIDPAVANISTLDGIELIAFESQFEKFLRGESQNVMRELLYSLLVHFGWSISPTAHYIWHDVDGVEFTIRIEEDQFQELIDGKKLCISMEIGFDEGEEVYSTLWDPRRSTLTEAFLEHAKHQLKEEFYQDVKDELKLLLQPLDKLNDKEPVNT
ncbi:hypothetical protein [Vibrio harveyi]|uniref:hypothetical protein n=1 Tax=Vibrio harveyi TaxID=669 RepID=UPI003CF7D672